MAKKITAATEPATTKTAKAREVEADNEATTTPVKETKARASAVPPKAKAAKPTSTTTDVTSEMITSEMIAEKAYHLWKEGHPGGEHDHWLAAERQLRGN